MLDERARLRFCLSLCLANRQLRILYHVKGLPAITKQCRPDDSPQEILKTSRISTGAFHYWNFIISIPMGNISSTPRDRYNLAVGHHTVLRILENDSVQDLITSVSAYFRKRTRHEQQRRHHEHHVRGRGHRQRRGQRKLRASTCEDSGQPQKGQLPEFEAQYNDFTPRYYQPGPVSYAQARNADPLYGSHGLLNEDYGTQHPRYQYWIPHRHPQQSYPQPRPPHRARSPFQRAFNFRRHGDEVEEGFDRAPSPTRRRRPGQHQPWPEQRYRTPSPLFRRTKPSFQSDFRFRDGEELNEDPYQARNRSRSRRPSEHRPWYSEDLQRRFHHQDNESDAFGRATRSRHRQPMRSPAIRSPSSSPSFYTESSEQSSHDLSGTEYQEIHGGQGRRGQRQHGMWEESQTGSDLSQA